MAIPTDLVHALRMLYARLAPEDLEWALVGSFGLAIRGAPIEPKDIDLMTDREGAYRIERLHSDFIRSPVSYKAGDRIESHFGTLSVDGVKVDIMGDFRVRLKDGDWHGPPDFSRFKEVIPFEEMSIPVLSLEWEYDSYCRLGREDRADTARRLLFSQLEKDKLAERRTPHGQGRELS